MGRAAMGGARRPGRAPRARHARPARRLPRWGRARRRPPAPPPRAPLAAPRGRPDPALGRVVARPPNPQPGEAHPGCARAMRRSRRKPSPPSGRAPRPLLYADPPTRRGLIRRSSVVEHRTVNPLVVGSNPTAGAIPPPFGSSDNVARDRQALPHRGRRGHVASHPRHRAPASRGLRAASAPRRPLAPRRYNLYRFLRRGGPPRAMATQAPA